MSIKACGRLCQVVAMGWLLGASACWAQEAPPSSELIKKYLEPTTAVIVRVQLSQAEAALKWLGTHVTAVPPALAPVTSAMQPAEREALARAGVEDVYMTLALPDAARGGVVVFLPTRNPDAAASVVEAMVSKLGLARFEVIKKSDMVIVAGGDAIGRQLAGQPRSFEKLPASLQACFEAVVSRRLALGLTLTKPMRDEVSEIWPDRLPMATPIPLSPKQVVKDAQHLAVSFKMEPAPELALQLRYDSAVQGSGDRNYKLGQQVAAAAEPFVGQVQVARVDSAMQLVFDQSSLEAALKRLAGSSLRQASAASQSNQLKQIMLAMHTFENAHKFLPPRESRSAKDQPLLSWRVHILPYIEQKELYDQFHLDEPWDSPHNIQLADRMPDVFKIEGDGVAKSKTRIVLPMLAGSAWNGDGPPVSFPDITDGTSNTVAVYIAPPKQAVLWSKPEEPALDEQNLVEAVLGGAEATSVGYFDGSVRRLSRAIEPANLKAIITHQGGEVVDPL